LGIPYYVLNFKDIFEKSVINYFKDEYLKGEPRILVLRATGL